MTLRSLAFLPIVLLLAAAAPDRAGAQTSSLVVRVSWGHRTPRALPVFLGVDGTRGLDVRTVAPQALERGDRVDGHVTRTTAGGGDVDGVTLTVDYPGVPSTVTCASRAR